MNWKQLLSSPPPATAWALSGDLAAVAVRERRTGVRGAVRALPGGIFQLGPAGLQGVDRQGLAPQLAALAEGVGGDRRPALVLPTAWFRSHLLELDGLPRQRAEMEEVIRWRLKKLLPVPPADMRLSVLRVGSSQKGERVLTVMVLERAIRDLEGAFEDAGVVPGFIVPRLFPLDRAGTGWTVTLEDVPGHLALLASREGSPVALRSRMVPPGRSPADLARGEIRRLEVFLEGTHGLEEHEVLEVSILCDDEDERRRLEELLGRGERFRGRPAPEVAEVPDLAVGAATRLALLRMLGEVT